MELKMDNTLIALIVGILGLFGWGLFNKVKRNSAEALLENTETKEKANKIDEEIAKNQGLEKVEEEKRKEIQDNMPDLTKPLNIKDILDFFNKKK